MNEMSLSWQEVEKAVSDIIVRIGDTKYTYVVGIANGGLIPATLIAKRLNIKTLSIGASSYKDKEQQSTVDWWANLNELNNCPKEPKFLLVDDISDTGNTFKYLYDAVVNEKYVDSAALVIKPKTSYIPKYYAIAADNDTWIKFPWE